jgi:hypothetical protein
MDFIVNTFASVSGLWKKVAQYLPLLAGVGSVLVGGGSILLALGRAGNAAAAIHVIQGLSAQDPNVIMIVGGLTAMGIHSNHSENKAAIADATTPAVPPKP